MKNKSAHTIHIDFLSGKFGYRLQRSRAGNELLAKAVGIKGNHKPSVIDATAGLGQDGVVLAKLGCDVTLIERSPIIHALLQDALERALKDPRFSGLSIKLIHNDANTYLSQLNDVQKPDVIYIDPMYPHRTKSALVKKEMRALREIVGDDEDSTLLLQTARTKAKLRVVVKRPRLAAPLGELKPNFCIEGKTQRFDVYIQNS